MRCWTPERLSLVLLTPQSPELGEVLARLWAQMQEERKLDTVFPSCDERWSADSWADQVRRDGCQLVVCCQRAGGLALGYALLAGVRPRRAFLHFGWFSAVGLQVVEASRWACDQILRLYDLDVLVGLIPETNHKAIRLAELTGYRPCGSIPLGSYIHRLRHSVTTRVYCYTRRET